MTGNGRASPRISRKGTEKFLSGTPAAKKKTVNIYAVTATCKALYRFSIKNLD